MDRISVVSSNVWSVGYDESSMTLEVAYRSGGVYHYYGVSSYEYQRLLFASSKGTYMNEVIKPRYRCKRIA